MFDAIVPMQQNSVRPDEKD